MKQPLPNADDLTTRYALNDLDPVETEILRKEMHADADLLIEAECQRRTWERITKLPLMSAPPGLLEDTARLASSHRRFDPLRIARFPMRMSWAAAAVVLVAAGWNLLPRASDSDTAAPEAATVEVGRQANPTPPQPWVDRRDVIRVGQQAARSDSAGDVRPLTDSVGASGAGLPRRLQLAGSTSTP
jgi:hypothetical protein